jgi:SAM-dependent methyltransferase
MATLMHEERLAAVGRVVVESGARHVLDLGCGDGDLLVRLLDEPGVERIVGVDICAAALDRLRARLAARIGNRPGKVDLVLGSLSEVGAGLRGFDCAVLVETIEHLAPGELSGLERSVFFTMRPRRVVVTTPNAEFNPLLGVPSRRFRHPGHRFEWPRDRFRSWAHGVARRSGYAVGFQDIAGCHPVLGGASQMAVFDLHETPMR